MIDLYGMSSPNVFKISIMLEETELAWRGIHVNVAAGEQYDPKFLAISPNNKVPVLVDSEGPGGQPICVFESAAMLLYLADKTGKFLSKDAAARSVELQWLMMQTSTVGPMFGQLVHFVRYAPEPETAYSRARYNTEMRRILDVLNKRLDQSQYFGPAYSIADIAVYPWIRAINMVIPAFAGKPPAEAFAAYPAMLRWFNELSARPKLERGVERLEQDMMPKDMAAFQAATPEGIDRFVGRGKFART